VKRGEWKKFEGSDLKVRPMGSVAYKLALVSAGLADITFTLVPKHEWDVAAGVALVESAGGFAVTLDGSPLRCNNRDPLLKGLIACGPRMADELTARLGIQPVASQSTRD
jgi:myo-inositol-1(or 4)-monophosphatase